MVETDNSESSFPKEDEVWVELQIKCFERSRCISRVLSVDREAAVAVGDNYASELHRLKLRVVLHSGDIEERSYIIKAMPCTPERRKAIKEFGAFQKEAKMLTKVLPEMELLLLEKNPSAELLWPICFGVRRNYETILIEDLKALNFRNADRQIGLNMEECSLVVKSLGKYHALSAVLIERGEINPSEFDEVDNQVFRVQIEQWQKTHLEDLAQFIEDHWDKKWSEYPTKLRKLTDSSVDTFLDCLDTKGKKFSSITHGDCWTNNIMFKYDDHNMPQSLRFIDFQAPFYRPSCIDIHYLLSTSLRADLRPQEKPKLYKIYYDSLVDSLKLYGYNSPLPTFSDIEDDLKATVFFSFIVGVLTMPIIMRPSDSEPIDMEDLLKSLHERKPVKTKLYDPSWMNIMKCLEKSLIEAKQNGIFE